MGRVTSVTLGEPLNDFISGMIESGRYNSVSEVIRTSLRLLEEKESKLNYLREAVKEHPGSGKAKLSLQEIEDELRKMLKG